MTFQQEMLKLRAREGFYSNDPNDRGGECIYGIARRRWPGWSGWKVLDARKPDLESLKTNVGFQHAVDEFYRLTFWEPSGAPLLGSAGVLMWDAAVQHGVEQSVVFLQQALNVLNERGTRWPDLQEDGDLGPKTAATALEAMKLYQDDLLWSLITVRGAFYFGIVRRDQTQEKWYRGWMIRARELYFSTRQQ